MMIHTHFILSETINILGICTSTEQLIPKLCTYRGAGKSLARPGRKQATATEDFELNMSYL